MIKSIYIDYNDENSIRKAENKKKDLENKESENLTLITKVK